MISQAIKTISRWGASGMMLLLLSMASCVNEPLITDQPETPSDVPEGMVKVGLYTNAGDYQTPVSRAAANEGYDDVSMPWVFVFSGNNDNAAFVEVKQAGPGGTLPDAPYVILTKQNSPVRLLIVANAPATFFNGTGQVEFTADNLNTALAAGGMTFITAVNNILNTAKLSSPSALPYEGAYIPMSGAVDLPEGIDKNTTIGTAGSKVDLRRVVAKVTVQNSASGFMLSSASVAGAKQYGRLYQALPVQNIAGNTTNYGAGIAAASAETTLANPLYIYESASGETSVIVSGVYNGSTYYYKLAFKDPTDGSVMAVTRNMWYQFKITAVSLAGYSSFNEAVAGSPSNIAYTITVVDQSSYDMLDNGQYYLGLSNSALSIVGARVQSDYVAVTVTTNATAAMIGSGSNSIAFTGAGLTPAQCYPSALNLSSDGTPASTEIIIRTNTVNTQNTGTITIKLGNIVKNIPITNTAGTNITTINGVSAEIILPATAANVDQASPWLSLNIDGSSYTDYTNPVAGSSVKLKFHAENNTGNAARAGVAYVTAENAGRTKYYVVQNSLVSAQIANSYVGTFHRWNETGERVIRMNNSGNNAWTAMVISGNFIKLDTETLGRTNTGDNTALTGSAEDFQVTGNAQIVSGTGSRIYFRIGLTSKLPGGSADSAPRYGLVLVSYNNNTRKHLIYVRQGEAPDVIDGTVKWSPYNLSDPSRGLGGPNAADHSLFTPQAPVVSTTFADYPTQVGYMFRWNLYNPTETGTNRAWSPRNPSGTDAASGSIIGYPSQIAEVWNTANDPCPAGYRHPAPAEFLNLAPDASNSYWGLYADGFFDRGTIIVDANFTGVMGTLNYQFGTYGRLFYNAATNAAIFMPVAGTRVFGANNGYLQYSTFGSYPTSNLSGNGNVIILLFSNGTVSQNSENYNPGRALAVRCVKNAD